MAELPVIAVVGAGLVGSGWALVFARAGHSVQVHDPDRATLDRLLDWAGRSADELERAGLIADAEETVSRIVICPSLDAALEGARYVQESVFETVEAKTKVSLAIDDTMSGDTVVGSSSSGIPASQFTERCRNRSQFLIAHPVNPPHLIPVVELVPAPWTDPQTVTVTRALMASVGQVPVGLTREIEGFVLNRLQGALLNEAWALYDEGYATLADIDATISHGLGLRWSFMGPFETIDLNAPEGIADYAARLGPLYYSMALQRTSPQPWPEVTIMRAGEERRACLPLNDLADRRAWRDVMLTRLTAFKKTNGLVP